MNVYQKLNEARKQFHSSEIKKSGENKFAGYKYFEKPEEIIVFCSPMSEANLKGCHPVQNLGAVETYIRRYLWVAALEIVEHDAVDASEGVGLDMNVMADHIIAIQDATDEKSLLTVYQAAYRACGSDKAWQKKIIAAKDAKKASFK